MIKEVCVDADKVTPVEFVETVFKGVLEAGAGLAIDTLSNLGSSIVVSYDNKKHYYQPDFLIDGTTEVKQKAGESEHSTQQKQKEHLIPQRTAGGTPLSQLTPHTKTDENVRPRGQSAE